MPRDDVILSPQTVQVKGENGNLASRRTAMRCTTGSIPLAPAQREQAKIYQSGSAVIDVIC